MECRKAEELLHLWIDGELDEDDRAALTAHLAGCGACARKLAEYRRLGTLLDQIDAQTKVPAGLHGRIMDAVRREAAPRKSGAHSWTRWAASAAAILLLGGSVGVLWRAGIWPGPMGKSAAPRYEMAAEEAAPQQAPAEMEAADALEADDKGVAMEEPAEAPAEDETFGIDGDTITEVIWNVETGGGDHRWQGGIDAVEDFSIENGLTVIEKGDDSITVQWADDGGKQALLGFLMENGELIPSPDELNGDIRILRIRVR